MYYRPFNNIPQLANIIGAIIGGLSCFIILLSCIRYKHLNTISGKLVFWQNSYIILESVGILFLSPNIYETCVLQAFLIEFATIGSMLWACMIVYVLLHITQGRFSALGSYKPENDMPTFSAICFIGSLIVGMVPVASRSYGLVNGKYYCYIHDRTTTSRAVLSAHYGIMWSLITFILIASVRVYYQLKNLNTTRPFITSESKMIPSTTTVSLIGDADSVKLVRPAISSRSSNATIKAVYGRLIYYPLLLLIWEIPISVYRIWLAAEHTKPPLALFVVAVFLVRCHGMYNLLVFAMQPTTRREWRRDTHALSSYVKNFFDCKSFHNTQKDELDCSQVDV